MAPSPSTLSPKVSVLIPAYNAMDFLPDTVSSALAQTYQDFELIIINDGSTDNITAWANSLSDPRVRLISQENTGLSGARNTGLACAKGEYIAFLDADDLWLPTKLEKQVRQLDNNPAVGLVYSWVSLIDETGVEQGKQRKNYVRGNVWVDLTIHNIIECGSVALVRRTCFDKVGTFDATLPFSCSEDWDMWLRIAAHYDFELIEEPLILYRCHSNNLSSRWQPMEESFEIVLKKAFDSAPASLQVHKSRSYGFAKLRVAWKALQNSNGDYKTAQRFEQEAISYYPQVKQTSEYYRFKVALILIQLFGLDFYTRVRQLAYRLVDFCKSTLKSKQQSSSLAK